jgi:hypothetical protein
LPCRVRDPLTQVVQLRPIIRRLGYRRKQAAGIGGFFDRANIGLSEGDIGREIVSVDDDELVINSPGHAHAQECDNRHED